MNGSPLQNKKSKNVRNGPVVTAQKPVFNFSKPICLGFHRVLSLYLGALGYKYNHGLINRKSSTFLLIYPPPHAALWIYSVQRDQCYFQTLERGGKNWFVRLVYSCSCFSLSGGVAVEGCLTSSDRWEYADALAGSESRRPQWSFFH